MSNQVKVTVGKKTSGIGPITYEFIIANDGLPNYFGISPFEELEEGDVVVGQVYAHTFVVNYKVTPGMVVGRAMLVLVEGKDKDAWNNMLKAGKMGYENVIYSNESWAVVCDNSGVKISEKNAEAILQSLLNIEPFHLYEGDVMCERNIGETNMKLALVYHNNL